MRPTGAHLNKSIVGGVAMGALVGAVRRLSGCRRVSVAIIVSAVLAAWSSGAMAASNACRGAAGTSAVTGTAALLYLQCYYAIPISGNPLQTFGGSTFVRKNPTTASYYLADRSNLGIDIIDGQALRFSRLLKPSAADPVGGFIGQLIWTNGPATTGTTRLGTPDESHSGPNGMTIYTDPISGAEWLFVADGGCNTKIDHASAATPSSAGTEGACGTPADPSTLPNANYGTANCINGTSTKGCYPTQHQPNVKLFNLTTNPNAEVVVAGKFPIPTGGGNAGSAPLGFYAPTGDGTVKGKFGASRADAIAIGTVGKCPNCTTYMLVSTPGEPFIPVTAQPTSTKFGACDAAAPTVPPETPPPPFKSNATASFPYLTLFSIGAGSPPTVTYLGTINIDDTSTGSLVGNGPFGCDFNGKRPPNSIGGVHWDTRINRFIVALPNVLNNIPVNQTSLTTSASTAFGSNVLTFTTVPSTIVVGQSVVDFAEFPTVIPAGTTVIAKTATTVTMSATATGGGVPAGDVIWFDGSGPGQNFVPDGPTGGAQNGQGCFYPQGTPATANSVGGFFWDCDGGLLVIDPTAVTNNTLNTIGYTASTAGVVLKLGYCSPGSIAAGPDLAMAKNVPSAPYVGDFANVLLGCSPKFNGNTAGTGSAVNIAENYSVALDVKSFGLPGPFPAIDPVSPFNQTVAGMNPSSSPAATPPTPGCSGIVPTTVQKPDCPTMGQRNGGAIFGYPAFGSLILNGVTAAHLNVGKFTMDPHWYVAVGGSGFSSTNIANLATKTAVIGYVDALSNELIEFTPTSSGSNTIAFDEQYYLAFLPVNGVAQPQLPAGDFTGNGVKLCGNAIVGGTGTVTSRGCVIVFRQQYLSPLGPRPPS
jgi:hypothetical protein